MRRILLLAAALAIPVSGASVALSGVPAWAGVSITCTTISGTAATTITISGCSGGVTGGSSVPIVASSLATGGTATWVSGSTTTFGIPTLTPTSAKKCPDPTGTADKLTAPITADTGDGIKVPGSAKGAVCIAKSGAVTALKALKIK